MFRSPLQPCGSNGVEFIASGPQDVCRCLPFFLAWLSSAQSVGFGLFFFGVCGIPFLMSFPAQVDGGAGVGFGRVVEPQLDGTAGGGQDMQTNAAKAEKRRQLPKD